MLKHQIFRCVEAAAKLIAPPFPPPTERDDQLVHEFKENLHRAMSATSAAAAESQEPWSSAFRRLQELAASGDPREFLRWDIIQQTMYVSNHLSTMRRFRDLRASPDWETRWRPALEESQVGRPIPFLPYLRTSGNLAHQASHLWEFERRTGARVEDLKFIFEFGGGYGCMCRLAHQLGFRGRYIIYDFAAFSTLQQFYLKSVDIPLCSKDEMIAGRDGVLTLSDLSHLREVLNKFPTVADPSLFIAMWSISEAPSSLRNQILEMIGRFRYYFLGYQSKFHSTDNVDFFRDWGAGLGTDVQWQDEEARHIPASRYRIGVRSN